MKAYVYQAALLCEDCAQARIKALNPELVALADRDNNSDMSPQGPHSDGGGEADAPQHCDACNVFLENPLTGDGRDYVQEQLDNYPHRRDNGVLREWADFYGIKPSDEATP